MGKSRMFAAALLAAGTGFVAPSFAEDVVLVKKEATAATKDETFAAGSAFTKWLFAICAKDYKALTGDDLPADAKENAKKAFEEFKKKKVSHDGGEAPKSAIIFFADRLAIANGDGTAVANALDGKTSLDQKVPLAKLGKPLGWAPDALGSASSGGPAKGGEGGGGGGNAASGGGATADAPNAPVTFTTKMTKDERVKKMIEKANWITAQRYPYLWGGGHNAEFKGPYDCSGAVSAVLHAGGCLASPLVSGELAKWGDAGAGEVTLYANDEHVYMSIDGKFFGTLESNPGGGAAWFDGSARPGFAVRHVPLK